MPSAGGVKGGGGGGVGGGGVVVQGRCTNGGLNLLHPAQSLIGITEQQPCYSLR